MTRRYVCKSCKDENDAVAKDVLQYAENKHIQVTVEKVKSVKYTFMGYNRESLPLFADGYGDNFPAFLTHRAALDKKIIDMMRPMFDKGVRPESFSDMLLELHTKEYTRLHIRYERDIAKEKRTDISRAYEMFSAFNNKEQYNGCVPTGRYLSAAYKQYHGSIREYLAKEVKKRGVQRLSWDVSYKEAKKLCQYRGNPVFKGLVTAMNEFGEVRIQFHIVTDAHDQMLTAIEAFKGTTEQYGLPGVRLFIGDNPAAEKHFFSNVFPTLREQQNEFDANDESTPSSRVPFPYDPTSARIAIGKSDINQSVDALKAEIENSKIVGLDCEWKVSFNGRGMQTGEASKIDLIQLSYFNSDNSLRVLIIRTSNSDTLPHRLVEFFRDDSIKLVGVNVGGDVKRIGRDFGIEEVIAQRTKGSVINLGVYARERDVVQSGCISLADLSKVVLKMHIKKEEDLQFSDWKQTQLTYDQIKYAAIDAMASLLIFCELRKRPNLTSRLKKNELLPGKRVDIVLRNGNVASMATRAATGVIMDKNVALSHGQITPRAVRCGQSHAVVEIEKIYAPLLKIPGYKKSGSKHAATLGDFGTTKVVLPIAMLKEHVQSDEIRVTTVEQESAKEKVSKSVPASPLKTNKLQQKENVPKATVSLNDQDEILEDILPATVDGYASNLSEKDIEYLRSATFTAEDAIAGRSPLRCKGLRDPPNANEINDRYSSVLGDAFHAMDRVKVPIRHEAKKAYYVALRDAFLVLNPIKLKELKNRMRAAGMGEHDIEGKQYYNQRLFQECINRHIPSPKILYWRVRAVFVLFGSKIDSKTKAPLFNETGWRKANNLLQEILQGYYSDPLGIPMYTKKMRADGTIMRNKYGMEMIECMRGTNRTEAYHKNLVTTFGGWHCGVEMSDCILAERRHRPNHRCSERRRLSFPKLGHFDSWLVDSLQLLVLKNHNCRLYPSWSNASEFKATEESFDTVALHNDVLQKALEDQCDKINKMKDRFNEEGPENRSGQLTREQTYISLAMNSKLPFLRFASKEENKKFAKCVLSIDWPQDDELAAIYWCQFVDGCKIFPKLPVHMRNHREKWEKNQRIKNFVRKSKEGAEKLADLNRAIAPQPPSDDTNNLTGKFWGNVLVPVPFPMPQVQAMHGLPFTFAGGTYIGSVPYRTPIPMPKRGKDTKKRKDRACGRCKKYNGIHQLTCNGRGVKGRAGCEYFNEDGTAKK